MTTRPTIEQMRIAAEWLDCNDGQDNSEGNDCWVVARWLREQAFAKEVRDLARTEGVPLAKLKRKIAERTA